MNRIRYLEEIRIQDKIEPMKHKDLVLKIFNSLKYQSEITSFFEIKHHRYGVQSFETHRFYYIKSHLLPLLK